MSEEEKKNLPQVTPELLKRVFSYLTPYWKQLALTLLCIVFSSIMSLMPSVLTGKIIDEGLIGRDFNKLIMYAQHITFDMRNQMYSHLQSMSQRFFTSNNQGDIITRMTSDIDGVKTVISGTFTSILSNSITLVVALIAMYQKNWILATVGIIIVPLFTIPTRKAGQKRWSLTQEAQACNDEINGILGETMSVSGQTLVKLFCKEEYEYDRYEKANRRMIELNIKESMAGRWFRVILTTITSVGPMLLYLVGGILMLRYDSDLTVGDITVLVALLGRMYGPVNSLLNIQVDWMRSMAMFSRIFEYFDMPVEIQNAPDAITPDHAEGSVEFKHVNFYYEPSRQILKDVTFKLDTGRSIAIVGPSGSGKSTLVNLIPRLYDAVSGEVLFDGINVKKLDLTFLRGNIGVVTQDTYLFNGTIRENLLYVKPDASEAELVDACERANIYDFISNQPNGLDTMVGNRGSERKIQDAIDPLVSSRTSILIAHRLSTILAADEILVIKDGEIAERGKHKDLVKAGGVYTELYETQFKGAMEPAEEEPEPDEPIGWDGGGSYSGPHRVRRRTAEERKSIEEDFRIYGDSYEEFREEMMRDSERGY